MKKLIYFLGIVLILSNCTVKKKPTFIKVDSVEFLSLRNDTIHLRALAYFKNENDIGGKIATDAINVSIDGTNVAKVSSEEFKVPANKEFSIPLNVAIPSEKIFENNKNGILGGILNAVINNSIKVQFKGKIRYKVLGFSNVYEVNKTEEIKIKL